MWNTRLSLRKTTGLPGVLAVVLMLGCTTIRADEPKQPKLTPEQAKKPVSFWMEKKLEYTQDIFRGLVSGDLDEVAEKSEKMRVLSRVEGWIRRGKPGYRAQLQAFELANSEILRNARADKIDGATLAYQQLTVSCVSCHKILRSGE